VNAVVLMTSGPKSPIPVSPCHAHMQSTARRIRPWYAIGNVRLQSTAYKPVWPASYSSCLLSITYL